MARNYYNLSLFFLIIIFQSISKSHPQPNFPSANLLCISECETCSATCSPPPSPPPPNPKLPPLLPMPPQYSPPAQPYYYFTSPAPSSPPPPRSKPPPPPPLVSVYNPGGNTVPARNFSYPYYYFYVANAASRISLPYFYGSYIFIMLVFFTLFLWMLGVIELDRVLLEGVCFV